MSKNPVVKYYQSFESRMGYRLLKGVKHFGYYPEGQEDLPKLEAQMLMNEQLAIRLDLPAGSRVLDAGAGEGNVAIYLAKHHQLKVDAVDLIQFNVDQATANAATAGVAELTSFQVGDYQALPFGDASFDAVYTMETLTHSPDYRQALREFYRVLKPGGKLVLFEYTIKAEADLEPSEVEGMKRIKQVNRVAALNAFNEFTFGSMGDKLAAAGFKDPKTEDITARMWPMLAHFAKRARPVYKLARFFHLEDHVINAMSAVESYDNPTLTRYEISTARKWLASFRELVTRHR